MRSKLRFNRKRQGEIISPLSKLAAIIKVIRVELFIATIGLILSLGQYFQNTISVRINITNTWRSGYTSETRERVNRFTTFLKEWKDKCAIEENSKVACASEIKHTVAMFASNKYLYPIRDENLGGLDEKRCVLKVELKTLDEQLNALDKSNCEFTRFQKNDFVRKLLANDIEKRIEEKKKNLKTTPTPLSSINKSNPTPDSDQDKIGLTAEDYIEFVNKYRNAIIECLNTLEAVKAVIQSKPLPFRVSIFYKDTLEGRYRDIIEELRNNLDEFIVAYRKVTNTRETEAWYVLTSDESNLNDIVNILLYFTVFTAALFSIYVIKQRMKL